MTRGCARWRALPTLALLLALLVALDAGAQTRLVIVSGLGGTPRFTQSFGALSTTLATAAHERLGLPDSTITWLGEPAAPRSKWYRGPSHRDTVERVLERLAERPATEQLVLVLVGHGSGEGDDTRISLPGPDLTTRDFARILGRFGARRLAFVNLTSASGDMAERLAAPGRVVITATTSAFERNESHFGSFFVAAFAREGADTDKDNRVSLLEAFRYAEAETKRLYDDDGRLATEHARLVDRSAMAPQFFLTPGAAASGVTTERLATLYAERAALDEQVQLLKARKASMSQDAYETELERLLVALALTAREIRELEKGR